MSVNLFYLCTAACLLSTALTVALITILKRRAILDQPNERSLHVVPTPRGGGWAILIAFATTAALRHESWQDMKIALPCVAGAVLILLISFIDDIKTLKAWPRFLAQAIAVGMGLFTLHGNVFQGWLPPLLDNALAALAWLWFVNLFNFMDGMDGLAGGEALAIASGLYLVAPDENTAALLLAAAVLGFLVWNWSPAKIFMGDVGSIPLGYLLGWFLLRTAENGQWAAVLLLPLYFLIDATVTLLRRLTRREKIWQAHRQHFYQQAVQAGKSHRQVATAIMLANAVLVALAVWLASAHGFMAVGVGIATVLALLIWMKRA